MTLRPLTTFSSSLAAGFCLLGSTSAAVQVGSDYLRVDAFGYETFELKVAAIRQPVVGFDAPDAFLPGPLIEVVRQSDGAVVLSAPPTPWSAGQTHATSGDRAWSFDFTDVTAPGDYFLRDALSGETSEEFTIGTDVHAGARRASMRTYFYQRSGFAKSPPFADPRWADGASHLGPLQDLDCRLVTNPVASTALDLSGGWYDAGDYNKYVNFTDSVLLQLLAAYEANPAAWAADLGIPESGDTTPDILDEVRWGLEWMARMQQPSGGVLHKVSVYGFNAASPPSADASQRVYGPITASATGSGAVSFARGAYVFRQLSGAANQAFAADLEARALLAWSWLEQNPQPSNYNNAGFSTVAAEKPAWEQGMTRVAAACWLALLTDDPQFHSYVASNYNAYPAYELTSSGWSSPYQLAVTETLLRYAERAASNAVVRADIENRFVASMRNAWLAPVRDGLDPYRAWLGAGDHVWGSNRTVAAIGVMHAEAARLDPCNAAEFDQAARDYMHFFHGMNARGFTYLTAMEELGAENSVREMYHAWFGEGTIWDRAENGNPGPAPGYLTGGPNVFFVPDGAYTGPAIVPPMNQPPAKSYRDWNDGWPVASWQVTEPSTGYQAAYVLLSAHVAPRGGQSQVYCPATPNVVGDRGHVAFDVQPSLAAGIADIRAECLPPFAFGLFVYGESPARVASGNGSLCLGAPQRINPVFQADAAGSAARTLDLGAVPFTFGPGTVMAGETWGFQAWHRDGTDGWNFSDGVRVTFLP